MTTNEKNALANKARSNADRRLREANHDQWVALMHEEHENLGIVWNQRLSATERAERDIRRLAAEHGLNLGDIADRAAVSEAFATAPSTTLEDEVEARRVAAATEMFGSPTA